MKDEYKKLLDNYNSFEVQNNEDDEDDEDNDYKHKHHHCSNIIMMRSDVELQNTKTTKTMTTRMESVEMQDISPDVPTSFNNNNNDNDGDGNTRGHLDDDARDKQHQYQEQSHNRSIVLLYTCVHLALWSQIGVLGRFWISEGVTSVCYEKEESGGGAYDCPSHGAEHAVRDVLGILACNALGSFLMGFLTENKAHLVWFEQPKMPVSFLPQNHFVQHYEELLTGLRVGFCGSMTTFSSWAFQMVSTLTRGRVGATLAVLIIEVSTSLVSFILGEHLAIRIHMLVVGMGSQDKRERTTLWHHIKNNTIFSSLKPHKEAVVSVVESHKGDELWLLRKHSQKRTISHHHNHNQQRGQGEGQHLSNTLTSGNNYMSEETKPKGCSANDHTDGETPERYDVEGTIVLTSPYLKPKRIETKGKEGGKEDLPVVLSPAPTTTTSRNQRKLRAALNVMFTLLLLCFTILWVCLMVYDTDFTRRRCWLSLLLAPLGCTLRWRMCLDYNAPGGTLFKGRLGWFPLGTFGINVAATCFNSIASAVELHYCASALQFYWLAVSLSAFKTGFNGSLSTVSTFISEVNKYMLEYPRNYKGWTYLAATLVASIVLGFCFYSWSVYLPNTDC